MIFRLAAALRSAKSFKTVAIKAAKGVGHAKTFARNIQANHFSLAFEKANAGDVGEQFDVGERYYEGRGIEKSFEDAAVWFHRAACGGSSRGQAAYALMLILGRGVERDPVEAWKWIEIALGQNDDSAVEIGKKIRSRITAGELSEGRLRAAGWKPSPWKS